MDYELLALMLENYKRLYIKDERERGSSETFIQHVVETDIEHAIEWAKRGAILDYEERRTYE